MKLTLTKVSRQKKQGQKGEFVSIGIQVQEKPNEWINGFGDSVNANWKEGDIVEIEEITENTNNGKTYKNFKMPQVKKVTNEEIMEALRKTFTEIREIKQEIQKLTK